MKRWVSLLLATTMLLIVSAISLFAVVESKVIRFNSYSSPVSAQQSVTNLNTPASQPIARTNSVDVSYNPSLVLSFASWSSADIASKDAKRAYEVISEELAKYSHETLNAIGLKKVYLVNNLYVDGTYRSGMPEGQFEDALYFDISAKYFTSENGDYMRRTIHHELRHLADFNLYKSFRPTDTNWTNCNVASTSYGNGGAAMYKNVDFAHAKHPKTGFITGYATSGIDEDRAEVFAYFMTDRSYLHHQAQNDASLNCKIVQTEQLLNSL